MPRKRKMAIELLSQIGTLGYDLQFHHQAEIAEAMKFMRTANPELFDWLAKVLAEQGRE